MKEARSDASGSFLLGGLPRVTHLVEVVCDDFAPKAVDADPAAEAEFEMALEEGIPFEGRVLDQRGEPIEGVHVAAATAKTWNLPEVTTDPDGRFGWRALAEGTELHLHGDCFRTTAEVTGEPFTVTVPDKVKIEIRLIAAEDGSPVGPPAAVWAQSKADGAMESAGETGVVTLEMRPPGPFTVHVQAEGRWHRKVEVEADAEGRVAPVVLRLKRRRLVWFWWMLWHLRTLPLRLLRSPRGLLRLLRRR